MAGLNLDGKNILVTGAGRGIGRAIAVALVDQGSNVFALSKTPSTLESLVKEQPTIIPIIADLSDWEGTRQKLEGLEAMDGLVNNAGMMNEGTPANSVTKQQIYESLNINLLGAVNCMQVISAKMIQEGKSGSIVNVSSNAGLSAIVAGFLPYVMSKAGLDGATRQFATELGPHNIRVNSVNPTLVMTTDMSKSVIDKAPEVVEKVRYRSPMKRLVEVNDVTGTVLYFLSDLSSMVTATCNIIDGGALNCMVY